MNRIACSLLCAAVMLWPCAARAENDSAALEEMKRQMEQLQQQLRQLQNKMEKLESAKKPAPTPAVQTAPAPAPTGPIYTPPPQAPPPTTVAQPWSPSQPITLLSSGSNYLNISFDTLVDAGTSTRKDVETLERGDHDPKQRGFSLRNSEIALDGAVDPYFKAFGNIVWKLDNNGESEVELEEAYGLSTSLPWNLQVKTGQFFTEFGRQNSQHPHAWDFVDQPLVMGRMFGPEGLRQVGARVSWLAPTPFYTEVMLAVLNGRGGAAFSFRNTEDTFGRTAVDRDVEGVDDLLYVPRVVSSFDLTDTQTIVAGVSGAFGPNDTGNGTYTQVYGADLYWKWRPERAEQGFPFVAWQTEGMYRRYEAGADPTVALPDETLKDGGFYSQLLWGFHLRWVAGLRGEYVSGNGSAFDAIDPLARDDRARLSPNLTFYPTEFSKIRLQYNYDHDEELDSEHSVWLQVEFLLGAHGAHKF